MPYFSVALGFGANFTTLHPYNLIFQMKTKVENSLIPQYGLSLSKIGDVCSQTNDYDYLVGEFLLFGTGIDFIYLFLLSFVYLVYFCVDVIDLMTGISTEREYDRDGKVTKMIVFELMMTCFFMFYLPFYQVFC